MDKYEYRLKAEQIEKLVKKKDYATAVKIADTIDWRRVKNLNMLYIVADIYEAMERYEDCMEILNIAYDRAPVGRMILYKMTEIATKTHNFSDAISLYREFVKAAPHDQSRYILKYQIYRERGSGLEDQIRILQEYKTHEYQEKWAYELACRYADAGLTEDCVRECDELILWFSEGEYVLKAMDLKKLYEPLTAAQQEKYDQFFRSGGQAHVHEDDYEETEVKFSSDKFSTINLQAELAANLGELLQEDADIEIPELEPVSMGIPSTETEEPETELELEDLTLPGENAAEAEAAPVTGQELELEELSLSDENAVEAEAEPASGLELELEELTLPDENEAEKPEAGPAIGQEPEIEELELPVENVVEEPKTEPVTGLELELEELTLPDEGAAEKPEAEPVTGLELELEELTLPDEGAAEKPEAAPVIGQEPELEELELPVENAVEEPEIEPITGLELELEELTLPDESAAETLEVAPVSELEPELEELSLPMEEPESSLPEESAAACAQESLPAEEPASAQDGEVAPEEAVEKQITGQLTIDDILLEWENKKAEARAILEATSRQEEARKEKVRQETAELVRLISGTSEEIPEDVQQILKEADEAKKPEPLVTEDDLPRDVDDPAEDLTIEELEILPEPAAPSEQKTPQGMGKEKSPAVQGPSKVSRDTTSMNMIQELERSLAREVSEMAVNAGHLTKEQARMFAYFISVKGMSEQLSRLFKGQTATERTNSSRGNLVVTGTPGNGKTTLAIDIVKALQRQKRIEGRKLAKISGQKLNSKDIYEVLTRLKGGALIVERAGEMSDASMMALSLAMEGDTGGLLIILEDTSSEIRRLFLKNKNFASKFDFTIDIPIFTNDELVTFAKSYASELGYAFDEFAVLALYDRIGNSQTNDHVVSVAEVKDVVDDAIARGEKRSVRHLFAKIMKKNIDHEGRRLLREEDFE
ncbi:MAG: hypothetical protein Q4C82_01035 [Eubacteriales bacterium]|nr:hypothetical protein [Eubacteriales bacterium]